MREARLVAEPFSSGKDEWVQGMDDPLPVRLAADITDITMRSFRNGKPHAFDFRCPIDFLSHFERDDLVPSAMND